jgi:CheY-like chemotaxis protein
MVYGFLKQSGGHVEVESGLGYGTTFRLYLPFASELAGEAPRRSEAPKNVGGLETVLLVEDEAAVRRLLTRVLSGSGYRVIQACNGEEALEIANESLGKLDLLVTDLVMPRMGGRQLAISLREKYPHLRVLFVSGYTEDASFERELDPCVAFLQKPLAPPVLIGKVRELLDSNCSAHGSDVASKMARAPRQHDG